jgi:hypothetical protein
MSESAAQPLDEPVVDCMACAEPVRLTEPHVAFVQQIEREHDGVITVTDSAVAYYQHLSCTTWTADR